MRRFSDFLFAAPAVALIAAVLKAGGTHMLLPFVVLPLWGMYLLGRNHGIRVSTEAREKAQQKEEKP